MEVNKHQINISMFKQINVSSDFSKFITADYTQHTGSCIKHQVSELTDIHNHYSGFPTTYCFENTIIHQLWWDSANDDIKNLSSQLDIEPITVSTILQPPGCVIPLHRDTFYQINKKYPDRTDTKVRANIFLEDYKLGQFIQYIENDKIHTVVDWKKGDALVWDHNILHLSSNAGMENKYTMQLSGFLK